MNTESHLIHAEKPETTKFTLTMKELNLHLELVAVGVAACFFALGLIAGLKIRK